MMDVMLAGLMDVMMVVPSVHLKVESMVVMMVDTMVEL